jgi:hypothetical protein
MEIANPIYDVVFKYMMEDNTVAKLVVSSIIGEDVVSLVPKPQEHTRGKDKAKETYNEDKMNIVVLYNASSVDKSKCPETLKYIGTHEKMKSLNLSTWTYDWDYQAVKKALNQ